MLTISFVCLGNICRSPMAEAVFKKLAEGEGIAASLCIQSFATSYYEEGNPVYPLVARTLELHGITGFSHRSRQITLSDIKNSDYVLVMDHMNMSDIVRLTAGQYSEKIFKLGYFLPTHEDIDDPYYTRDFERAYSQIYAACSEFLKYIIKEHSAALFSDNVGRG